MLLHAAEEDDVARFEDDADRSDVRSLRCLVAWIIGMFRRFDAGLYN